MFEDLGFGAEEAVQVADFNVDELISLLSKAGMRVRAEVLSTAA